MRDLGFRPKVVASGYDMGREHVTAGLCVRETRRLLGSTVRTPMLSIFYDTVDSCFNAVVEGMLGRGVRDEVYRLFEEKGISHSEISNRFDDVVRVLMDVFGQSARVIIYKTIVELHREYSQLAGFPYEESLRDRLALLKERVVTDHLYPRRLQIDESWLEDRKPWTDAVPRTNSHASA